MSKMNYDKLFWNLISKSGKNAYKINKVRKEAKPKHALIIAKPNAHPERTY